MTRTAPWFALAVFCVLTPSLALASWGRPSSTSSDSRREDKDKGKKNDGDKGRGDRGRGHGSNGNNGGGGGVSHGGGNGHVNGGGGPAPDDRHRGRGRGHTEHGNGNGYGHDHDDDDHDDDGGHPATGGGPGGGGRDHDHDGDDGEHDHGGGGVVVVDPYPRWYGGWWWGGGSSRGYREDEVRHEPARRLRLRLLGEAAGGRELAGPTTSGSLMGSLRIEGPRWGIVLDARSLVRAPDLALSAELVNLGRAHLTFALLSGDNGGRLRLEAGAATLFSQGLLATAPSLGVSAELPLHLGLGLEGAAHATAFPFLSSSWSAGGYASLGALSLHAGWRELYVDGPAGAGPYIALALTFQ